MFKKILVPLDGSAASQASLRPAIELARLSRGSLTLVHVIEGFPMTAPPVDEASWQLIIDALRNRGQAVLDEAVAAARASGVDVSTSLIEFPNLRVADAIVDLAREAGCDLIVIGTHGRRGVTRWVLGSDAERVLRGSPCPVLLVHPHAA